MPNTIFVESSVNIDSAVALGQYLFNERLITVISEFHMNSFQCAKPSITISEYCATRLKENNNALVLLEYNKGNNPLVIDSDVIKDTFSRIQSDSNTDRIRPVDYRSSFIGHFGQQALYNGGMRNFTYQEIYDRLINPFFINMAYFELPSCMFSPNVIKFLYSYVEKIKIELENLRDNLESLCGEDIEQRLKDVWMKVMDYFILREVFNNGNPPNFDSNECIIVVGDSHRKNLQKVFRDVSLNKLNEQEGSATSCVNLFSTYTI